MNAVRIRKFLKDLLATWSVPKSKVDKTIHILEILKQNISEVKLSQEMSTLDPSNTIVSQKRKMDEQNLRLTIAKVKGWLNTLVEKQRLETLSLKYAIIAATLSAAAGIGATYALYLFYPLKTWTLGQFTPQIGLVVSLIAIIFVWKTLRYNSSPTQIVVAVLITPLFAAITTTCIVLATSALTSNLVMAGGGEASKFVNSQQTLLSLNELMNRTSLDVFLLVGLLLSIVVVFLFGVLSSRMEQGVMEIKSFKPPIEAADETDDDLS